MVDARITEYCVNKIKKSESFVAIVTKNFVEDEQCMEECRVAELLNKPMYAVVKHHPSWKKIKNRYMWRDSYDINILSDKEIMEKMKHDIEIIRAINDF